jgi:hypothetical protein
MQGYRKEDLLICMNNTLRQTKEKGNMQLQELEDRTQYKNTTERETYSGMYLQCLKGERELAEGANWDKDCRKRGRCCKSEKKKGERRE